MEFCFVLGSEICNLVPVGAKCEDRLRYYSAEIAAIFPRRVSFVCGLY